MCVSACTQKAPNLRFFFLKPCLTNIPRLYRLPDGQLSSPYLPSPSFSSFGAASVMCCFPPASSNTALPMLLYTFRLASIGFPSGYLKNVFSHALRNSEPTRWFSQTMPDEHPTTPPPWRWPALFTLRTPTKFQLVWRRLCDDVLFRSSCLFELTICATRGSDWS